MSDYAVVSGGSLKFKGGDSKCVVDFWRMSTADQGRKKNKKSSHSSSERRDAESSIAESSRARERERERGKEREPAERSEGDRDEDGATTRNGRVHREDTAEEDESRKRSDAVPKSGGRQMTEAEKKFEEIQRQRVSFLSWKNQSERDCDNGFHDPSC